MARFFALLLCAFFFAPSFAHAAGVVKAPDARGLVGYWKLDEGTGTLAGDASGKGNHTTLVASPTWTTDGRLGKALTFNGSSSYASKTSPAGLNTGTSPRTIAGWVKVTNTATVKVPFVYGTCGSGNDGKAFGVYLDASEVLNFWGCGNADFSTGVAVSTGVWHHIAVTYNGTNVQVYLDGGTAGSATARTLGSSSAYVQIGAASLLDSGNYYYSGSVDDVRIYARALSATEVAGLYAAQATTLPGAGRLAKGSVLATGLANYWSFNGADLSGSTAYDRVGSGNGSITGAVKVAGRAGQGLSFNGNSQYVIADGTYPTGTSPRTLCAWVKSDDTTYEGNADHVINYGTANTNQSFGFMIHTGNQWRFFGFGSSEDFDTGVSVDTDWHYHCLTYDGTTVIYYYDAANVASQPRTLATTGGNMTFGTRQDLGAGNEFNGKIDEVRLYTRALSAPEISQLYRMGNVQSNVSSATLQKGGALGNGLVGHWTFDGADFTTSIVDRSGQGNHGYVGGGLATSSSKGAGKLGQALRLNGSNCAITPKSLSGMTSFTLAGWVRPSSAGSRIGFFGQNDAFEFGFSDADTIEAWTPDGGSISWDFTSSTFAFNTWHHVAYMGDANGKYIYVDGVAVASAAGSASYGSSVNTFNIGGCGVWDASGNGLTGSVDDVRVYNRALPTAEVQQLYRMGGPTASSTSTDGGGSSNPAA